MDDQMTFEQFKHWYSKTDYFHRQMHVAEVEAEEAEGLDLTFPSTNRARFWYIITFLLVVLMKYSIPGTLCHFLLFFVLNAICVIVFFFALFFCYDSI